MNNPEYLHGWWDDISSGVSSLWEDVSAPFSSETAEEFEASQQAQANMAQEQEQFKVEQRNQALKALKDVKVAATNPAMVEQILGSLATLDYIATGNASATDQWWQLEETMLKATPSELYAQLINLSKMTKDPAASAIIIEKADELYKQMEKMAPKDRGGDLPSPTNLWWAKNSTYVYMGAGALVLIGGFLWWRSHE